MKGREHKMSQAELTQTQRNEFHRQGYWIKQLSQDEVILNSLRGTSELSSDIEINPMSQHTKVSWSIINKYGKVVKHVTDVYDLKRAIWQIVNETMPEIDVRSYMQPFDEMVAEHPLGQIYWTMGHPYKVIEHRHVPKSIQFASYPQVVARLVTDEEQTEVTD